MKRKVLIIDDSPLVRELCRRALRGCASEVLLAKSGSEGFDLLRRHSDIDAVLLDVHMPVMGGTAVLAAMRETGACRDVPVILLAQPGDEAASARGLALGAVDIVQKFDDLAVLPGLLARAEQCYDGTKTRQ